jgi:hypothetical protein
LEHRVARKRLDARDVEGGGDASFLQRRYQGRFVDHIPARHIDQVRRRLHQCQRLGVDQVLRLARQRKVSATMSA